VAVKIASHFENGRFDVIIADVKTDAERDADDDRL
jgi:hypothetical protein